MIRSRGWMSSLPSSRIPSSPANKSLRGGSRGPETGVRGIPSPFIKIYERGRDTPHPSFPPLLPRRKDFLGEILGKLCLTCKCIAVRDPATLLKPPAVADRVGRGRSQ